MSFVYRLSHALPRHFWGIWVFGLVAILVAALGMFWTGWRDDNDLLASEVQVTKVARVGGLAATCFGMFLAAYIGFMLWAEDFAYQDQHSFTDFSAIGKVRPPSIWPDSGRFWPLGYQEYNLIGHLSPTAAAYLAFGAIQLLVGLWLLYRAMSPQTPTLRLLTLVMLMLAPAFAADFAELTYADRNVVFYICVLVFVVDRYDRRPTPWLLIVAIAVSYSALYYKETTAALFGVFAMARILLRGARGGLRSALRSPLELAILLSCAYFAVQLALTLMPSGGRSRYVHQSSVGAPTAAWRYLTADPLLAAFVVAFAVHVVLTLRRRAKFDPLWDSLAAGGVLHIAAVSITGLAEGYLLGPTELVAAVTLLRLVSHWWHERPGVRPILAAAGGATIAATTIFGAYRLIQRKNVVWQTEKIADFLVGYYNKPGTPKPRMYFVAEDGIVMNFISMLRYRGLPFHLHGESPGTDAIDVAGSEAFAGDLCIDYEDFVCRHDVARVGDLVVRLSEEEWSPTTPPPISRYVDLGLHEARLEPLFQASPAALLSPLRPVLALLYRVSPTLNCAFYGNPLPDDWLNVSAAKIVASADTPRK